MNLSQNEHAEYIWWAYVEAGVLSTREAVGVVDAAQRRCDHGHCLQGWCR